MADHAAPPAWNASSSSARSRSPRRRSAALRHCETSNFRDNKQSLNWTNLAALRPAGDDVSISKYAKNGMSAKRIRCWRRINFAALQRICVAFWAISKCAQDALLWSLQNSQRCPDEDLDDELLSDAESVPVKWHIDGHRVCRRAFLKFIGLGEHRFSRTRHRFQGVDERCGSALRTGRPSVLEADVNAFLARLYYSIAETTYHGENFHLVHGALRFRERSQHSTCAECDRLRAQMRHSRDFVGHATAADKLLGHLRMAWLAKEQYWCARQESRNQDSDLLTFIIDGFDKSKMMLPRWSRGRMPKGTTFERHRRPHVNVTACLAHGYGCYIFMSDEHLGAGSSWTWECVMRSLERVFTVVRHGSAHFLSAEVYKERKDDEHGQQYFVYKERKDDEHGQQYFASTPLTRTFSAWCVVISVTNTLRERPDMDPERAEGVLELGRALATYPQYARCSFWRAALCHSVRKSSSFRSEKMAQCHT
ncbi:unnamed protein product, partial [Effrenium voratum]